MEKKLACLVMAALMSLGLSPGPAWAADDAGMLNTGNQYKHVRALQAGLSMPGYFSAAGNLGTAAAPPQMSNAHTEIPEADAYSADSLQACRPGDRGNAVAALQQRLKTLEYYDYSRITGYYGPVTREAMKRFQRVNGLAANGLADIETMTLLSSERAAALILYPGDRGSNVLFLQQRLRELGYLDGEATGCLDNATVEALQEFQAQAGCRISSQANQSVRARIKAADAPPWDGVRRTSGIALSTKTGSVVDKMLSFAVSLVGRPYAHHTRGPFYFDSDGLICYVLRYMGAVSVDLDAAALSCIESWEKIVDTGVLMRGDILFFSSSSGAIHAGISLGDGQFIHASASGGAGVVVSRLAGQYQKRFLFARRIF
jgi:peptidoglycan hydrolase-like protein with peptidoglycan-binding domain